MRSEQVRNVINTEAGHGRTKRFAIEDLSVLYIAARAAIHKHSIAARKFGDDSIDFRLMWHNTFADVV